MKRGLLVFEDGHWPRLSPLADLTPVPYLRFGVSTLLGRWCEVAGVPLWAVEMRREVAAAASEPELDPADYGPGDEILAINAAALPSPGWLAQAFEAPGRSLFRCGDRVVGARLPFREAQQLAGAGAACDARLLALGLDAVSRNAAALMQDLLGEEGGVDGSVHPSAVLLNPERISVGEDSVVDALAVLDAREGPVLIGPGVYVAPHTVVVGPCVVEGGTELLGGVIARSSIGPECRIAGEVEECIWQGYANKRHHGFVGHSVIGEWVNLGALTTTSDLKNNYGPVRVWADGAERDSGSTKVGSFIGAHVKTGTGTLLPTGCSIGVGSNLFGGGRFAPKRVPAFAWWDGERAVEHRLEAFLETARRAMRRRDVELTEAHACLLSAAFAGSAAERVALAGRAGGGAAGRGRAG
ncbi:MAG: hypothetical protein HZC42_04170 [Candidatus Eisenbacteria bacterium]|nr:hypothetical protein [Candidatus Eisenbacteria bacterium]